MRYRCLAISIRAAFTLYTYPHVQFLKTPSEIQPGSKRPRNPKSVPIGPAGRIRDKGPSLPLPSLHPGLFRRARTMFFRWEADAALTRPLVPAKKGADTDIIS